jgi:hypothetical protein
MQLTKEQRIFVVKTYLETKSFTQVQQLFEDHFPERTSPTSSIRRVIAGMTRRLHLCVERNGGHVEGN